MVYEILHKIKQNVFLVFCKPDLSVMSDIVRSDFLISHKTQLGNDLTGLAGCDERIPLIDDMDLEF